MNDTKTCDKQNIDKLYERLSRDTWGMIDILPYYIEGLTPDKKYDLMKGLEDKNRELLLEGEL